MTAIESGGCAPPVHLLPDNLTTLTNMRDFYNGSVLNHQEKVAALNAAIEAYRLLWLVVHDDIAGSCVESSTLAKIQTFLDPVQFPPEPPKCTGKDCDEYLTWGEHAPDCEMAPGKQP